MSLLGPDPTMPVDDVDPYEVVRDLALAAFLWSLVTGLDELEWPLAHLWRPFFALFGLTLFLAMSPILVRDRGSSILQSTSATTFAFVLHELHHFHRCVGVHRCTVHVLFPATSRCFVGFERFMNRGMKNQFQFPFGDRKTS